MAAIANITISDGEATPVSHIYLPINSGLVSNWREDAANVPLVGQSAIQTKMIQGASLNKLLVELTLPILEVTTGQNSAGYSAAPKVAHVLKSQHAFFFAARSTNQQRVNHVVLARNLLSNAIISDLLVGLRAPF